MADNAHIKMDVPGYTPGVLAVQAELQNALKVLATFALDELAVEMLKGRDTLWFKVSRPGKGAIMLRTLPFAGAYRIGRRRSRGKTVTWPVTTSSGLWTVTLALLGDSLLRLTVSVRPKTDLLLTFWPRDLFPLDAKDDPTGAVGRVEAAQRGFNGGVCYLCLTKPAFGSVLYMQNLTALNPFFTATKTRPDGVVGGEWPELGYQPPTAPMGNSPPVNPLPQGVTTVVSDALVAFRPHCGDDEITSARQFIDMLADIYPYLDRPQPQMHDWPRLADKTVTDLAHGEGASLKAYGHLYLHPYLGAEYPDSMVQLSVLASLRQYAATGAADDLSQKLAGGLGRFYDKALGTIRRYLPNVGADKNADAVDSWYLYHPLMNLGRLAVMGDARAKQLFVDSLDYAVKTAQHFHYVWPIQFDVTDYTVITRSRSPQGRGQTDVGGLYAYVMLLAHELTCETRYVREARKALKALEGTRFNLVYQTNITAWGAAACLKLAAMGEGEAYRDQALVFIAGILHNCELWDSRLDHARHYSNFFGLSCLHDGPYMAAYEVFEVFAAFDECLRVADDALPASATLLMGEFRRYALDVGWYFYPAHLPDDAVAGDKIRNGRIDRRLAFPLEDLYGDGQPAGQVGQEIYGCGGAFVYAAHAFYQRDDLPFVLFCDLPADVTWQEDRVEIELHGSGATGAVLGVLPRTAASALRFHLADATSKPVPVAVGRARLRRWHIGSLRSLVLTWSQGRAGSR